MRQIADKSDGVRQQDFLSRRERIFSRCRVESRKELVLGKNSRARQSVEQCRFSRIRISDDCNGKNAGTFSLCALCRSVLFETFYLLAQSVNATSDVSSVGFQLGFAGAPCADTAAEP